MELNGAVVFVTGASSGIGRACAQAYAAAGAKVALFARSADRLERLAGELRQRGAETLVVPGDVARRGDVEGAVAATLSRWGRLDILLNNAAVGLYAPVAEMEEDLFRRTWETNVMGAVYAIQAVVPAMRRQGQGLIVNISSTAGKRATPITSGYAATKHALNALSDGLRIELAASGIKVLSVYPGLTNTNFQATSLYNPGQKRALDRGVSPALVARRILRAGQRGRAELFITPWDHAYITVNAFFPRLVDLGMKWVLAQRHPSLGRPAPALAEKRQGNALG
jgi:short-subunit dehydrogenase